MTTVTAVPLQPVKRGYLVWLWLGIALALVSAYALARQGDPALLREARGSGVTTTPTGLQYKVIKAGAGGTSHPADTDVALVQYQGRLLDGTTFDKSQQPTPMPVAAADPATGRQGVVPGFSQALKTMTKGSKYRFWIPPSLGYGAQANGPIPANSTLVFDVELVDFIPEATLRQMQAQQGMGGAASPVPQPPR